MSEQNDSLSESEEEFLENNNNNESINDDILNDESLDNLSELQIESDQILLPEIKNNIKKLFLGQLNDLSNSPITVYRERLDQLPLTINTNERYGRSVIIDFLNHGICIDRGLDIPIEKTFRYCLLNYPEYVLNELDIILKEVLQEIYGEESLSLQPIYIRFNNLNEVKGIEEFRSEKNGKFIQIKGTVLSTTKKRSVLVIGKYYCSSCKRRFNFKQPYKYQYKAPSCINEACSMYQKTGSHILLDTDSSKSVDYQIITIQSPSDIEKGNIEEQVMCIARDDIVDAVDGGDEVDVTGIIKISPMFSISKDIFGDPELKQVLYISNVEKIKNENTQQYQFNESDFEAKVATPELEEQWFEEAKSLIAPSLYGLDHIKSAILLQLYSGSTHINMDGTIRHGAINILLITDPGMGKTVLSKSIKPLCYKYQYFSSQSATTAGITAAVIKEGNGPWTIMAGAMVLANKGICIADEFDKINKDEMTRLHEQLQNRTVTVHKAGIHKTLNANCDVLALANPKKNRFDPNLSLEKNLEGIPSSLYNRFDLIYIVKDKRDETTDRNTIRHIIKNAIDTSEINLYNQINNMNTSFNYEEYAQKSAFLREHIRYMKNKCEKRFTQEEIKKGKKPIGLSIEAAVLMENFFIEIRSSVYTNINLPIPINNRSAESILRLASANAKMCGRDKILERDMKRALDLYRKFLDDIFKDPDSGIYDSTRFEAGKSNVDASLGDEGKLILYTINDLLKNDESGITEQNLITYIINNNIIKANKQNAQNKINKIISTLRNEGILTDKSGKLIITQKGKNYLPQPIINNNTQLSTYTFNDGDLL